MYIEIEPSHFDVFFDKLAEKLDDIRIKKAEENESTRILLAKESEDTRIKNTSEPKYTKDQEKFWELTDGKESVVEKLFGCNPKYFWRKKHKEGTNINRKKSLECKVLIEVLQHFGFTLPDNFIFEENEKKNEKIVAEKLWEQFKTKNELSNTQDINTTKSKDKRRFLGIVPSRTDEFVGRKEELENLYHTICQTRNIVVLHGMPGIGKTSLAKVFIDEYHSHFDHIAWVGIDSDTDELHRGKIANKFQLEQAFELLYRDLNHNDRDETFNTQQQFEYTIGLLNNKEGKNLLVIDNYDETILRYRHENKLPRTTNWKILVTSRRKVTSLKNVPLGSLSETEAINLFKTFCERKVDEDLLKKFLEDIDCHTLTIEIAAKSMSDSDSLTLEKLYERLLKRELDNREIDQIIGTEYSAEEGRLIKHLLCLFDVKLLSNEEVYLLKNWYFLRPDFYNVEGLRNFIPFEEEQIKLLLVSLSKKGWVLENTQDNSYFLHRLIQKVVFYSLSPGMTEFWELREHYLSILMNPESNLQLMREMQVYCNCLVEQVPETGEYASFTANIRYNQADAEKKFGRYKFAKDYLEEGITICNKNMTYDQEVFGTHKRMMLILLSDLIVPMKRPKSEREKLLLEALTLGPYDNEECKQAWEKDIVTIYKDLLQHYNSVGNTTAAKIYWGKLKDCLSEYPNSNVLEYEYNALLAARDYQAAWPIGEHLFKEYTEDHNNGKMSSSMYAVQAFHYGILLQGLGQEKYKDALRQYYVAYQKMKKQDEDNPFSNSDVFPITIYYIARLFYNLGNMKGYEKRYKQLWSYYNDMLFIRSEVSWDMVQIAVGLATNIKQSTATIVDILRKSFIEFSIHANNYKQWPMEEFNEAMEAIGWQNEKASEFLKEIETEAKARLNK